MAIFALDNNDTYRVFDFDKAPGTIMVKHMPSGAFYMVPFRDLRDDYVAIESVHRVIECMFRVAHGYDDCLGDLAEALQPYGGELRVAKEPT